MGVQTIELDFVVDAGWQDDAGNWTDAYDINRVTRYANEKAKQFNVSTALVKDVPPGGGHPVYAFTGTRENLKELLRWYCLGDMEGVEFFLNSSVGDYGTVIAGGYGTVIAGGYGTVKA